MADIYMYHKPGSIMNFPSKYKGERAWENGLGLDTPGEGSLHCYFFPLKQNQYSFTLRVEKCPSKQFLPPIILKQIHKI